MRHFKTFLLVLLVIAICPVALVAQFEPVGSHTDMYFPQLADGGGPSQQWLTTLTFLNPNLGPVAALVRFYGNDGSSLPIDFSVPVRLRN